MYQPIFHVRGTEQRIEGMECLSRGPLGTNFESAEVLFEAGHIAKAAGEDAQARDYWTRAVAADPNGQTGKAAREALAMTDAPLTVTNQVATRPDGDGEGPKDQQAE